MVNETHNKYFKANYDHYVYSSVFSKGDFVVVYDQDREKLGARKFEPLWHGPYVVTQVLQK